MDVSNHGSSFQREAVNFLYLEMYETKLALKKMVLLQI